MYYLKLSDDDKVFDKCLILITSRDLETNTDKLIDTIKYKLAYDEISLKDLYHLL